MHIRSYAIRLVFDFAIAGSPLIQRARSVALCYSHRALASRCCKANDGRRPSKRTNTIRYAGAIGRRRLVWFYSGRLSNLVSW